MPLDIAVYDALLTTYDVKYSLDEAMSSACAPARWIVYRWYADEPEAREARCRSAPPLSPTTFTMRMPIHDAEFANSFRFRELDGSPHERTYYYWRLIHQHSSSERRPDDATDDAGQEDEDAISPDTMRIGAAEGFDGVHMAMRLSLF